MQIVIEKRYAILIFVGLLVLAGSWAAYAIDTSGAWHSASQIDWTGFVFPDNIKTQLKGDAGPAGVQGAVGPVGVAGTGANVNLSGGLYGACYTSGIPTTCNAIYPAFCDYSYGLLCQCALGYRMITTLKQPYYVSYSCMKN